MSRKKLRRKIAYQAARLVCGSEQLGYEQAKREAARKCGSGQIQIQDLPTNREVREEIEALAEFRQTVRLEQMRREAMRIMRRLQKFHPQLIGSTLSGRISDTSTIELEVFGGNTASVIAAIGGQGAVHPLGPTQVRKNGELQKVDCLRLQGNLPFRIMVYDASLPEVQGPDADPEGVISRASVEVLEQILAENALPCPPVPEPKGEHTADRFEIYAMLLWPLEEVLQNPQKHPEGDALYHSLQVFVRTQNCLPYDEEFLLAALLHDVGKAIDPDDHVTAGLMALEGWITERTAWFIEHHLEARGYLRQELGARARRRLEAMLDFEQLLMLAQCDRDGREQGVGVPDVDEALAQICGLAASFEEGIVSGNES